MNVAAAKPCSPLSFLSYTVRSEDCDKYQHLNHAECFRILERARWKALGEWNHSEEEVEKSGIGPVIISMEAEFRKEVRLGETLEIATHAELLNSRFFKIYQVAKIKDAIHLRAEFKHALFSIHSRRLVSLSESWTRLFRSGHSS